jgi:hypothetical protein
MILDVQLQTNGTIQARKARNIIKAHNSKVSHWLQNHFRGKYFTKIESRQTLGEKAWIIYCD